MADDIFLSPEEQDERAKKWLKDNGLAIAAGITLGFGAIIGYNHYKDGAQQDAEQASALFAATIESVKDSKTVDISAQVNKLKGDYADTSYAAKAALIKASQLAVNDLDGAYNELQWVVDNAPEKGLVHSARIRQAKIKLSQGDLDSARTLASPATLDGFTSHYSEILGDIEVKAGDLVSARAHYETASADLSDADYAYNRILALKLERLPNAETVDSSVE